MIYNEHNVESPRGMAKEPSTQIEKEELYSQISDCSGDEIYETHTEQSIKSEESVDDLDYAEHPEISVVIPEQSTNVGVRGVDDVKYKAVDTSQHSFGQLSHKTYTDSALVGDQNAVMDAEGTDVVEYETYYFDHHSADKFNCTEYTEIAFTDSGHYAEVDAEGKNEVQYDANDDLDQHSDQLQSTEDQEDSFDQQRHDYIKNAEFAAVCMKSRRGSSAEKLEMVCVHCRLPAA
jgi:hypothetical protein